MIIYTNDGNPFGLKLLICAKLAKKEISLKKVQLTDSDIKEIKRLPILQLDSGAQVFSSSAAASYLLPPSAESSSSGNQWLEWSSTRLSPALYQNIVGKSVATKTVVENVLSSLVKSLNDTLSKSLYLTGPQLSLADIAVWSLLAASDAFKAISVFSDIDSIKIWHKQISELPAVKEALELIPVKELTITSLQQSNKFGGLAHIQLVSEQNTEDAPADSPDSQTQVSETVTADEIELVKSSFVFKKISDVKEPRTVLPIVGKKNNLITSALPYVNNIPHLGNIIGCVLSADIFARYSRTAGHNTLYISGTDEYGTATEAKALAENLTPQQICDKYFEIHNNIYRWFGIGFDYFGRTSTPEQKEITQKFFLDLKAAGHISCESVDQLLCEKCDRFLADRFVEGTCPHLGCGYEDARGDQCDGCGKLVNACELIKPRCSVCRATPVVKQSSQFFIDLPKIEPRLRAWLNKSDPGWTHNARVITKSWIREGLRSRCITRDLKWGIPVPLEGYEKKVFYVWFDAPIGYMSITKRYTKDWERWWKPDPDVKVDLYQFMAKDNVPFHSVMFPSTLLGINQGHTLVSHIMATEYLNYEDGKFSKSRGIGVFGNDAQDTGIAADVWRFYLASARPEGQDSNFSWNDLVARNNSELLNNVGNFINRALVFCEKNFDKAVPTMKLGEDELNLLALVNREIKGYVQSMEKAKFRDGIRHLLAVSRHGNQYMQSQTPWVLLKGTDDQKAKAGTVIGLCCNLVCLLANLLFPFMPDTSRTIYKQINLTKKHFLNPYKPQMPMYFETGHKIGQPSPLFTKIEQQRLDELKEKYGGKQEKTDKKPQTVLPIFKTVDDCERAIAEQGEKVRALKASGAEKTTWQPEVEILLKLKKQLTTISVTVAPPTTTTSVADCERAIAEQGEKVRALKASGAEKATWQPEVEILLKLKKQLTTISVTSAPSATTTSVADCERAIAEQAEKVRSLKASGVEKSAWQPEVDVLLKLKKQLAAITISDVTVPSSAVAAESGKKNKKKK